MRAVSSYAVMLVSERGDRCITSFPVLTKTSTAAWYVSRMITRKPATSNDNMSVPVFKSVSAQRDSDDLRKTVYTGYTVYWGNDERTNLVSRTTRETVQSLLS